MSMEVEKRKTLVISHTCHFLPGLILGNLIQSSLTSSQPPPSCVALSSHCSPVSYSCLLLTKQPLLTFACLPVERENLLSLTFNSQRSVSSVYYCSYLRHLCCIPHTHLCHFHRSGPVQPCGREVNYTCLLLKTPPVLAPPTLRPCFLWASLKPV